MKPRRLRRLDVAEVLELIDAVRSDRLLSLVEAAHQLGATAEEVRAWAEEGILPHRIVGGAYVFELALLVRWQLRGEVLARQGVGGLPTILA